MRPVRFGATTVVLVAVLTLGACGGAGSSGAGSSTSASSSTVNPARAASEVTTGWEAFFDGHPGGAKAKAALLEDGKSLEETLARNLTNPSLATAAKVESVTVLDPGECRAAGVGTSVCAKVNFIEVGPGAQPMNPNVLSGYAVYSGGRWLVSRATFCALLSRRGGGCPG